MTRIKELKYYLDNLVTAATLTITCYCSLTNAAIKWSKYKLFHTKPLSKYKNKTPQNTGYGHSVCDDCTTSLDQH